MVTTLTPINSQRSVIGKPLVEKEAESFYCSATVVSENHIMTAAHCYEGAIEKHSPLLPMPRTSKNKTTDEVDFPSICKDNGQLRNDWASVRACVDDQNGFVKQTQIERVEVRCPTPDGGEEIRSTTMEQGWPHPNYMDMDDLKKYDVSVIKVDEPWVITKPAKMILGIDKMIEISKYSSQTCRSFGYGLDNNDESGILHGVSTPFDILTEDSILYKVDPITKNRTDHGDSGGALFCKDQEGTDHLVAVISRGNSQRNYYALLAYNKTWIDMILLSNPQSHGLSAAGKEQWRSMTVNFQIKDLTLEAEKIGSCLEENQKKMQRKKYSDLKKGLKDLKKRLQQRVKNRDAGHSTFDLAGYLAEDYKMKNSLLKTCRATKVYRSR